MKLSKKEKFQRDYRDICYFVDHVRNIDFRISLIRSLGYKIGVNIVTSKRNEMRVQIAPVLPRSQIVQCAIVE